MVFNPSEYCLKNATSVSDNSTVEHRLEITAFGGMAAQNVLQEFSPELGQFLKRIHLPHIPTPPVWWSGDK